MDSNKRAPNRIPVHFPDEDDARARDLRATPDEPSDEGLPETSGGGHAANDAEAAFGSNRIDGTDLTGVTPSAQSPENHDDRETIAPSESHDAPGGAAHSSPAAVDSSGPAMAELVATRAELRRVESELRKILEEQQELREVTTRRQADFENYRKRVERERGESYQRTLGEVVTHLLPVADNLRRAVETETSVEAEGSEEFRRFFHGVELISRQLSGVLETLGVETVATVGQPFDPHIHEAVAMEQTGAHEPDTVIGEIVRGYRLGGKLLRPAMVKVAK